MRRNESLPAVDIDRGRGLADLKGRDPMDRRVEVESKARYGQALRKQMAANASRRPPKDEQDNPGWGQGGQRIGSARGGGSDVYADPPSCLLSPHTQYPGDGPGGGQRSGCSTPLIGGGVGEAMGNKVTAEKLAQVQDIMRQRLHALQEEQHKQWERIQAALREQAGAAREAAELAVQRQFEAAMDSQMRPLMGDLANARRECEAQALRVNSISEELGGMRRVVERLTAQEDERDRQLQGYGSDIEHLKASHEECHRFRAEMQREQRVQDDAIAQLSADQDGLSKRFADVLRTLGQHGTDIDHLKRAHEDCARHRAESAQQQRAMNDALAQLRSNQEAMLKRIEDVPLQIKKLRDEVPRIVERVARDIIDRIPRPEPTVQLPPTPAVISMPDVSEEAYAVLRNADEEVHELPSLQNTVGRAAACSASITHSQAISNRHASIDFDAEGRASVRDMGSRNGTFLNERRVPEASGLVMHSGDSIQLGVDGPCYTFEFGPAYYARWPSEPVRVGGQGARRKEVQPSPGRAATGRRPRS